jgi:hypothetical protein
MPLNKNFLKKFWDDTQMRDEVKAFLEAHLEEEALKRVWNKEDTHGLADAKIVLENAWKQLDEELSPKEKPTDRLNPAR